MEPDPTADDGLETTEQAGDSSFALIHRWIVTEFHWSLLVVPVLVVGLVYLVSFSDFAGSSDDDIFKAYMELLHPALLFGFLIVSWARWIVTRQPMFAFLGVLSVCVFSREIIGQGSSFIVYAGIIVLWIYASRHHERVASLLKSDWIMSFLFMCFVCYAASQILDRGAIKHIGRFVLADSEWRLAHSSNLEEALESLGGAFLLLASCGLKGAKESTEA